MHKMEQNLKNKELYDNKGTGYGRELLCQYCSGSLPLNDYDLVYKDMIVYCCNKCSEDDNK